MAQMQFSVPPKVSHALRVALGTACAVATVISAPHEAGAVSARVKLACAKDYYAHCSQHAPNSPDVRKCMRAIGDGLSQKCVSALVADGEVTGKEVAEARR